MRFRILVCAWLALALPCAAWAGPGADAGLKRVREFLDEVKVMQAAFRQEVVDGRGKVVEQSAGRLVMERPGRFRWDYSEPFERVIVSDGSRIWLYEADLAQVTVRPLNAGIGDTPAALLTGTASVLDRFKVDKSWNEDKLLWVQLVPNSGESDFAAVKLGFDGPRLARLSLDDRLGQETRIRFSDIQVNGKADPATFRFVPPAGADVIDSGAP